MQHLNALSLLVGATRRFAVRDTSGTGAPEAGRELLALTRLSPDEALADLGSSWLGLAPAEAEARLAQHGLNEVAHEKPKRAVRRLLELFLTPLSMLLLALSFINYETGEVRGAAVIAVMVVLSSLLSFVQERRSSTAAAKLRAMVSTTATVTRQVDADDAAQPDPGVPARRVEIPLANVVPGDIVHLSAGDILPADVRVLSARDLFVNQASLTGESLPVEKFATAVSGGKSALELDNVAFMGTNVVSGTATALVVTTGARTCFGSVASSVTAQQVSTSFDRGISRFIGLIIRFMAVMVPLVFLVNGLTKGDWLEAFLFAVAVAVGLTPEMLPMIVTINLAKGALAMAGNKVIVKRLSSIQNLGAMDVLCTDKTGTLTQDKVLLERHVDVTGEESEHVLEMAYLNSYYQTGLRNLLDVAVLEHVDVHARLHPYVRYAKVDEVPFDFQRRRMSVVVAEKATGRHLLVCKGAVEEVYGVCSRVEQHGEVAALEDRHHEAVLSVTRDFNEDGFRVIAVAYKELPPGQATYSVADESDLVLAGYMAFLDPPKETAAEAIRVLREHGVAVKVLTGDNEAVTRNICRQVGLPVDRVILGSEIDGWSDEQLAAEVEATPVLAKLSPAQKARVVKALHLRRHVVGFLGDGINDGPALKAADVGISVDTAVDIAKESADIILLEKSLLVLEHGVVEGRKVFGNIVKYIRMGASSNFGNMFSVLGASAFLPFLPMQPVQILVNNLLYDFSQTTVATDNVDEEYLRTPRQWDIGNIGRYMLLLGPVSSLFDYVTFGTLVAFFGAWDNPALFQTGWFIESLLSQTLVVHVIRTGRIPFLQSRPSLPLALTTIGICCLGAWLPTSSLAPALGLTPMPYGYAVAVLLIVATYLLAAQVAKTWLVRRFGLD